MRNVVIWGGKPLEGKVTCDGAKNAALPIIAGAILSREPSVIANIPRLSDVKTMIDLLRCLGARVKFSGDELYIDTSRDLSTKAPYDLVRKMRASFLIMGPLLVREGKASVPLPGGCAIGQRPVDLHLKGFQAMGANICMERGYIRATAKKLQGACIYLDIPSVGATENIMMAATLAEGKTVIENAAQEPEIVDLANFLNSMGAKIKGAGTSRIRIIGTQNLHGTNYGIIPDRVEASTYLVAGAITRGKVLVENVIPLHLKAVVAKLKECGCSVFEGNKCVEIQMTKSPLPVTVKTLPYPGFPTDVQAPFMSLCCLGQGISLISETVFENRFGHVEELRRMGAKIRIEGSNAVVEGVPRLTGAKVEASDLRAGAALCLAGFSAQGITEVSGMEHVERGYANFIGKFRSLGARISWKKPELNRASGYSFQG